MSNFGANVSNAVGVYAMKAFGIDTATCQFNSLVGLVTMCHCILPLLCIPLTFILIPGGTVEDLDREIEEKARLETEAMQEETYLISPPPSQREQQLSAASIEGVPVFPDPIFTHSQI
eukprot:GHVN01040586.1.p1 GENE.GHVN01040586.1~~GHVN01040586.1.p1  ORF type:complete len:118 (-),score=33.92 GHVN01040586.1:87-440(-)